MEVQEVQTIPANRGRKAVAAQDQEAAVAKAVPAEALQSNTPKPDAKATKTMKAHGRRDRLAVGRGEAVAAAQAAHGVEHRSNTRKLGVKVIRTMTIKEAASLRSKVIEELRKAGAA